MNNEEIKRLADLAKIRIDDADVSQYAKDFEGILEYIDLISSVDIDEVTHSRNPNDNVMRNDDDAYTPGEFTDVLLNEAPQREDSYVKVKKVL